MAHREIYRVMRLLCVTVALCVLYTAHAGAQSKAPASRLLDILVAAYPDFLVRHDGEALFWKDGTRMPLGEAMPLSPSPATEKSLEPLFDRPSLRDMFHWPYPLEALAAAPPVLFDPGRVRHEAFFTKMYGDCRRGEVTSKLTPVAWLPAKKGGTVAVTSINGVAQRLAAVSAELDVLPASFDKFLVPSAGVYNCRPIAGTTRLSAHGTGSAIDIAVKPSHYWRWTKPDAAGGYTYRNAIPPEIVRAFEKHGFIWGGKWYHYDTMHFEYRPEILAAARS